MTIQVHVDLRNSRLQAIETALGLSPKLRVYTGLQPADNDAVEAGTKLAEFTLPSDWLTILAGQGTIAGLPMLTTGLATGLAAHYRFYNSAGTKSWMQGTVTAEGEGGDAEIDIASIRLGGVVQLVSWTLLEGGA